MRRRRFLEIGMTGALIGLTGTAAAAAQGGYASPYRLAFRHDATDLSAGFGNWPWNDARAQSSLPFADWYTEHTRRHWKAWGPPSRQYPASDLRGRDRRWLQERVILTAARHLGLPYQHHHIPAFDPPAGWPWKEVAFGRNSPGLDCSNFTSFVYNFALGLKLPSGIGRQATAAEVAGPGGQGVLRVTRIDVDGYDDAVTRLQPADLLFIGKKDGRPGHVVFWLGDLGQSTDHLPLILDCTGSKSTDANGQAVPVGVHIRPFRRESWYAKRMLHAHRPLDGLLSLRDGTPPQFEEGGGETEEADD